LKIIFLNPVLEPAARSLGQLERGFQEHQEVPKALEARSAPQAARALQKHFERIRESLESWLAARGQRPLQKPA